VGGDAQIQQALTLTPGHSYIVKAKIRTSSGGVPTMNVIRTGADDWWQSSGIDISNATQFQIPGVVNDLATWTDVSYSFHLTSGNTGVNLQFRVLTSDGWLEVDDVVVEDLDVASTRLTQAATSTPGMSAITYSGSGQNTTFNATLTENTDRIDVTASLTDTSGSDRALAFDFCLPIDPTSTTWADTADDTRTFVAGTKHIFLANRLTVGDQTTLQLSTHPTCSVNDGTVGLSIAHDIGNPRVFKMWLDDTGLWVRYHVGLVANSKVPWNATFAFSIYTHDDPTWGLRAAMAKYVTIYPTTS